MLQLYCVQHQQKDGVLSINWECLHYQEPDIEHSGGIVFLGLPLTIVHTIDADSPLAPPEFEGEHPTPEEVKRHLQEHPYVEIICALGGTVEHTGNTAEKRHSYTLDDIFWNREFAQCVSVDEDG